MRTLKSLTILAVLAACSAGCVRPITGEGVKLVNKGATVTDGARVIEVREDSVLVGRARFYRLMKLARQNIAEEERKEGGDGG